MAGEASDELLKSLEADLAIDTAGWLRVGGTESGGYYRIAPHVLVAVPWPRFVQTELAARRSLEEFHRIAEAERHPQAIIVLVDRVVSQDSSSRRVWSESEGNRLRACLALVCESALSRAIGSFFIGLNRPVSPTKMFKDIASAAAWCSEQVREQAG